jgi:hypothetical protein
MTDPAVLGYVVSAWDDEPIRGEVLPWHRVVGGRFNREFTVRSRLPVRVAFDPPMLRCDVQPGSGHPGLAPYHCDALNVLTSPERPGLATILVEHVQPDTAIGDIYRRAVVEIPDAELAAAVRAWITDHDVPACDWPDITRP